MMKVYIAILFCTLHTVQGLLEKKVSVSKDPTNSAYDLMKSTRSGTGYWKATEGWCLDCKGRDQEKGAIVIQADLSQAKCLEKCDRHPDAKGCEWASTYVCTVHTREVSGGSGNYGHKCWAARQNCLACGSRIPTTGGNANGACCFFPFYYNGVRYNTCASEDHDKDWCYTDANRSKWGECVYDCRGGIATTGGNARGACCVGRCRTEGHFKPWCYTNKAKSKWGNCVLDEWRKTSGYCYTCNGEDQKKGEIVLKEDLIEAECLKNCKAYPGAKGCEWANNYVCTIHTREVLKGSGDYRYTCWSAQQNCQGMADEETSYVQGSLKDEVKETPKWVGDDKIPTSVDEDEEFFTEQKQM